MKKNRGRLLCLLKNRNFPFLIVALGFVWQGRSGNRNVPCLHGNGSRRYLGLGWTEGGWGGVCRFAAVRHSTKA